MSIQIGDFDVSAQILESEFRISVLERVVDHLILRLPTIGGPPITPADMDRIRKDVVANMQRKYPNSGIALQKEQS